MNVDKQLINFLMQKKKGIQKEIIKLLKNFLRIYYSF